jgi:hypothetical protein
MVALAPVPNRIALLGEFAASIVWAWTWFLQRRVADAGNESGNCKGIEKIITTAQAVQEKGSRRENAVGERIRVAPSTVAYVERHNLIWRSHRDR